MQTSINLYFSSGIIIGTNKNEMWKNILYNSKISDLLDQTHQAVSDQLRILGKQFLLF